MYKSVIVLFCSSLICVFSSFTNQNPNNKTMIIGTWAFERMEFVGEFAKQSDYMKGEAIKENTGVVLNFFKDGKYKAVRKIGGTEQVLEQAEYKISEDGKTMTIIYPDKKEETGMIASITKDTLKLSSADTPTMVFKKFNP